MAFKNTKRLVIKLGSSTLTHENGMANLRLIDRLVRVVSEMKNTGHEVVMVSSGAVAVGVQKLGFADRPSDVAGKQAAAAVGQCSLIALYDRCFAEYNYRVAQILLTRNIVEQQRAKQNTINTFHALLEMGAVPIVNENDTVLAEESLYGDNDRLSAIVASLIEADGLIILSDIDGLYDKDPRENPDAKLIPLVKKFTGDLSDGAGSAGTSRGTGGMQSKLEAARFATAAGIPVNIMNGQNPECIYDLLDGKSVGTLFVPENYVY